MRTQVTDVAPPYRISYSRCTHWASGGFRHIFWWVCRVGATVQTVTSVLCYPMALCRLWNISKHKHESSSLTHCRSWTTASFTHAAHQDRDTPNTAVRHADYSPYFVCHLHSRGLITNFAIQCSTNPWLGSILNTLAASDTYTKTTYNFLKPAFLAHHVGWLGGCDDFSACIRSHKTSISVKCVWNIAEVHTHETLGF